MSTASNRFRSRITGRFLTRAMDRSDPGFSAWIVEVALDVAFRESMGATAQIANAPHLFRDRSGRFWSVLAEIKTRPWEILPFSFDMDWYAASPRVDGSWDLKPTKPDIDVVVYEGDLTTISDIQKEWDEEVYNHG